MIALGILAVLQGCPTRSSDWLGRLPDGPEKRAFVLDCTGCHQISEPHARPAGTWRSEAQWADAVARMLRYAGATSGFPVISAQRDPARTAAWLAAHLRGEPPSGDCSRALPVGAAITEYAMPEPGDLPHDLAVDANGRVIVTGMFTHRMYLLEPDSTAFAEVAIPVERANPRAVEVDETGHWWVVLGQPLQLARYAPGDNRWQTFHVGVYPHSLALDGRGRVWFNGHFTRAPELIGFVDVRSGSVTNVPVPSHPTLGAGPGGPIPYELRAAPDGRIWGSELLGNRIFGYDPQARAFAVHELPEPASGPRRFDIDEQGLLWIPAYGTNALLRFDPRTAAFERFELPLRDAVPYVVRVDRGTGLIWIGTSAGDAVLSFDPRAREFRTYPLPSSGALVRHIAIDPRSHDVWLAYGASPGPPARIARLRVSSMTGYDDAWPQWSRDGRRLVFASTRDGDWEIYASGSDGRDAKRLTRSPGRDAHPVFTPDGNRIVFQSPRGHASEDQVDLYVMDLDGASPRRLVGAPGFNGVPVPSPAGDWIAFQRGSRTAGRDFHWELHLVDSAGRRERRLTNNRWSSQVPTWSPDGRELAFYANPRGTDQLFIMNLATGAVRPVTSGEGSDNAPAWSPDGRFLAFVSDRDGSRDLYRVEVATGRVQRLTRGLAVWAQPSWSPDGRRIVFSAKWDGMDRLFVVNGAGGDARPLMK